MATYTPNFNLYMPDPTDPLEDFRAEHNNNMQIIDGNLGGGGGGGGNVYGAFVNTNRVLYSGTYTTTASYTAVEDCAVAYTLQADTNNSASAKLNGDTVDELYSSASITQKANVVYLKAGQTLALASSFNASKTYKVYGLIQGTDSIFTPIIYSDNERVIGIWRDNKPLYQKSVYVGSLSAGSGVSLAHGIANIDTIANYEGIGFNTEESRWNTLPRVDDDVTYQRGLSVGSSNIVIWGAGNVQAMSNVSVTIWYTKTTDVAGSGNWNTDGVPTVHYSTSEQVIGTWVDGKPLYRQVINFSTGNVASNIDFDISSYMPANCVVRRSSHIIEFTYGGDTYHGVNWGGAYLNISGTHYFTFNIGSATYNKDIELTIEYTKTTD